MATDGIGITFTNKKFAESPLHYTTLQLIAPTFLPSNYAKKVHLLDTFSKNMVITHIVKPEETVHQVEIRAEL